MSARIIHVGPDTCHRVPVLENAGYRVEACASVVELREALEGDNPPDAVLISEGDGGAHSKTVTLVRAQVSVPIVLFRETQRSFSEKPFDLVVPVLDSPKAWLADLAELIARSSALRAESRALTKQSAELRRESAEARAKSRAERQRTSRCWNGISKRNEDSLS